MGDVSWDTGYKTSWSNATDKPAGAGGGFNISLRFRYDSASGLWLEAGRARRGSELKGKSSSFRAVTLLGATAALLNGL